MRRPAGLACRPPQNHRLTCNEVLVFHDGDVFIETFKIKEVGPGNPDLVNVGALPVVEAAPGGQHHHPLLRLPQDLQEGGHANVDIPAEVETLRGVDVIQKIPGSGEQDSGTSVWRALDRKPGGTREPQVITHPDASNSF